MVLSYINVSFQCESPCLHVNGWFQWYQITDSIKQSFYYLNKNKMPIWIIQIKFPLIRWVYRITNLDRIPFLEFFFNNFIKNYSNR